MEEGPGATFEVAGSGLMMRPPAFFSPFTRHHIKNHYEIQPCRNVHSLILGLLAGVFACEL